MVKTGLHITIGLLAMIVMGLAGIEVFNYVACVFVFIASTIIPDIDFILGPEYHRRGTHTILAGLIYAAIITLPSKLFSVTTGIPFVIAIFAFVSIAHFLHSATLKEEETSKSLTWYSWLLLVTGWFVLEFTKPSLAAPPVEYVFFSAFAGYFIHLAGDFLNAGEKKLPLLCPCAHKFGTEKNIVKTNSIGEATLFSVLIGMISAATMLFGSVTSVILRSFGTPWYYLLVVLFTVSISIGAFLSTRPKPKKEPILVVHKKGRPAPYPPW